MYALIAFLYLLFIKKSTNHTNVLPRLLAGQGAEEVP